jgi:hypothetical protein
MSDISFETYCAILLLTGTVFAEYQQLVKEKIGREWTCGESCGEPYFSPVQYNCLNKYTGEQIESKTGYGMEDALKERAKII